MTVFRLHGFGVLVPSAIAQHLAILRAVIHGESEEIVASSMNSETKFYHCRFRLCRAMSRVVGTLRKVHHLA